MPALFLQLRRNTEFWAQEPQIGLGERVSFGDDPLLLPALRGLRPPDPAARQLRQGERPLERVQGAPARLQAEAAPRAARVDAARGLVARRARRRGSTGSRSAAATRRGRAAWRRRPACRRCARGAVFFGEPRFMIAARKALPLFRKPPPAGVRVPSSGGYHYVLYSFAPGLRVLNAFLQAVTGLHDYAELSRRRRARAGSSARATAPPGARLPRYDTGRWSYYALPNKNLSTMDYHVLVTGFLENLCERTEGARLLPHGAALHALLEARAAARRRPANGEPAPGPAMRRTSSSRRRARRARLAAPGAGGARARGAARTARSCATTPTCRRAPRPTCRRPRAGVGAGPRAAVGPHRRVRQALARALEAGEITAEQRDEWRAAYNRALRTRARLAGARRVQLSAVIETLERDRGARAAHRRAGCPRSSSSSSATRSTGRAAPTPASGQRVSFAGSQLVFQYYPGHGLQIQPLANFGKANALWRAGRAERPARAARRAGRDPVAPRALHDLGVLVRLRRRRAAVDERDGAGHGDPGAVARRRSCSGTAPT